jgi:TolB-like protein
MQASRVRRSLEHYYLTKGAGDAVVITLPRGSYVPEFHFREGVAAAASSLVEENHGPENWPTLLLIPFENLTGSRDFDFLATGLVDDLAVELGQYSGLRVFLSRDGRGRKRGDAASLSSPPVDFELTGSLSRVGQRLRFSIHLLRTVSGEQLWAEVFQASEQEDELVTVRKELPLQIAAAVAEERGSVVRHSGEEKNWNGPESEGIYEAILKAYYFERNLDPGAFANAFEALNKVVKENCECGLAWAMMSRLWSVWFSHELSGNSEGIRRAIECGRNAVSLRPRDVSARVALGYALLLDDQLEACRREVEGALEMNPHTLYFRDSIGYLLTLAGDWNLGPEITRRAIELNPYYRLVAHAGLWLDAIRREDYESALSEAEKFTTEGTFWRPLMRITARVLSGDDRKQEIESEVQELLGWKPDFETRGRRLIRKYVKFPVLHERIEEGLGSAGIVLEG